MFLFAASIAAENPDNPAPTIINSYLFMSLTPPILPRRRTVSAPSFLLSASHTGAADIRLSIYNHYTQSIATFQLHRKSLAVHAVWMYRWLDSGRLKRHCNEFPPHNRSFFMPSSSNSTILPFSIRPMIGCVSILIAVPPLPAVINKSPFFFRQRNFYIPPFHYHCGNNKAKNIAANIL